jgi:hypothetical protein
MLIEEKRGHMVLECFFLLFSAFHCWQEERKKRSERTSENKKVEDITLIKC